MVVHGEPERSVFEREKACACSRGRGVTGIGANGVIETVFFFFDFFFLKSRVRDRLSK